MMRWIKTQSGSYMNLENAHFICIRPKEVFQKGIRYCVLASFLVTEGTEGTFISEEIGIANFATREEAQKYLDEFMEMLK